MAQGHKRFEAMCRNPAGDWRIEDVGLVCRTFGLSCDAPTRGSHMTVSHPSQAAILTIPCRRPIKVVYIKLLITYVHDVQSCEIR